MDKQGLGASQSRVSGRKKLGIASVLLLLAAAIGLLYQKHQQQQLSYKLNEYLSRLGDALPSEHPFTLTQPAIEQASYSFQEQLPELSLGLLESHQLNRCKLGETVFALNSSKSELQSPMYQALWHRQIALELGECADMLAQEQPELAQRLRDYQQQKLAALPTYWLNYTEASPELAKLWQPTMRQAQSELDSLSVNLARFGEVSQRYLDQKLSLNQQDLLPVLEALAGEARLYPVLREQQSAVAYLNAASAYLNSNREQCSNLSVLEMKRLRAVLLAYYMKQLQPSLAKRDSQLLGLAPALRQIYLGSPHSRYNYYLQVQQQFKQANIAHAKAWQFWLNRCSQLADE